MTIDYIAVFITAANENDAVKLAKALVEGRLAGCVNIIRNIRSIYIWQGKTEDEQEVLMIAKTQRKLFPALSEKIKELHSYTVPEIIAIPLGDGSADYLKWLAEATGEFSENG